ncbi:MAG: outer membrane protein assembly factor BamD [Pseudomonadota bacterium]
MKWQKNLIIGGMMVGVAACSSGNELEDFPEIPPTTLYSEAVGLMNKGDFRDAAKKFEEVDKQHPYSEWAERAILMSSFSYFQAGQLDESASAARRFLSLHPASEEAPYAQYLIAQAHYNRLSDIGRDQTEARRALAAYTEIVRLYPESRYASEAEARQSEILNHLAGKDMEVGRFYLGRDNYVAAINRFRSVISDYQTTQHVEEALLRLTEAYYALGVVNEAQTAAAVLGHNYPDSEWYADAYKLLQSGGLEPVEDRGSWISRTLRRVS